MWPRLVCLGALALGTQGPEQAAAAARRDEGRRARSAIYMNDFGELSRYRRADAALKPPASGEQRVVFLGDSVVDGWRLDAHFPGRPYVNRGIGWQTTAQMLVRFRQDVIALRPRAVLILAGTNDIAGNTGPTSPPEIEANYASMAELARAHGIRVIFASILPVHNYTPPSALTYPLRPIEQIVEINRWLKGYCAANGFSYADFFSAMIDDKGLMQRRLAEDGLHPNPAGYAMMSALAQAAIDRTLAGAAAIPSPP
jgi:lysophospholipase L1-like esterase